MLTQPTTSHKAGPTPASAANGFRYRLARVSFWTKRALRSEGLLVVVGAFLLAR